MGQTKKSFIHRCLKHLSDIGLFFILLVLPALTIWIACSSIQDKILETDRQNCFDEMSEMTAHMMRLATPESYYQDSLRRLSESFRWAEKLEDVERISTQEKLELYLFDAQGKRLDWPKDENQKRKASEDYIGMLLKLSENSETELSKKELSIANSFSGNAMTLNSLVSTPNTLIDFQGIGLRRFGAWFKVRLPHDCNEQDGYLLAWLFSEKLEKYQLANQAIDKLQKLGGPQYTFAWIDLNRENYFRCSGNKRFKNSISKLLSAGTIKSSFMLDNNLFSVNDTNEGIRLLCTRQSPAPKPILKRYNSLIFIVIPVIILLYLWKLIFKVNLNLSVSSISIMIYTFAAFAGLATMIVSAVAYQYEKQKSLAQDYQNQAIQILEKVDQRYTDSHDDLLLQYKHLITELSTGNKPQEEILLPLRQAQADDQITYASYIDKHGRLIFQVPLDKQMISGSLADKYSKIINRISMQCLNIFNSTRSVMKRSSDPRTLKAVTVNAVEGLLSGRSKFLTIKLDNDEVKTFMDMTIDNNNLASGCLIIAHEPQKLETSYLRETGKNISDSTGFEFIAFPKKLSEPSLYYPKFSYTREEPLWKLNDMLNQTQLSSFKRGKVNGKEVIVAAMSAHNLKNYNLFLAMPLEKIKNDAFSLSKLFIIGTCFTLLFVIFLSTLLIQTITTPINTLTHKAKALKTEKIHEVTQVSFSDSSELESISTGLTNMVVKIKEFEEGNGLGKFIIPAVRKDSPKYLIDQIVPQSSSQKHCVCYITKLDDNKHFAFMISLNGIGLDCSLQLAMACTQIKLYIETSANSSPYDCLKNLEEYFRINLRRGINGSVFAMCLDEQADNVKYAGFGNFTLLKCDFCKNKCEEIELPQDNSFFKDFKENGNTSLSLSEGLSLIVIDKKFNIDNPRQYSEEFTNNCFDYTHFEDSLKAKANELSKSENTGSIILYLHSKLSKDSANG